MLSAGCVLFARPARFWSQRFHTKVAPFFLEHYTGAVPGLLWQNFYQIFIMPFLLLFYVKFMKRFRLAYSELSESTSLRSYGEVKVPKFIRSPPIKKGPVFLNLWTRRKPLLLILCLFYHHYHRHEHVKTSSKFF